MPGMDTDPYLDQFLRSRCPKSLPIPKVEPLPVVQPVIHDDYEGAAPSVGGIFQETVLPIILSLLVLAFCVACVMFFAPILINR